MHRHGLLLGREATDTRHFGFGPHTEAATPSHSLVTYDGDAPICVIAPTGSGKGRDFLIPNLLTYHGPVIALDPKGELSAVCGRARRNMGHRVAVLDPFDITGREADRLNPFDLFAMPGSLFEADAEMLASMLGEGHGVEKDPFWSDNASGIIAGLIAFVATKYEPGQRNLTALRALLHHDDLTYHLAVLLDKNEGLSTFVKEEFTAYLRHSGERTREGVLSTATTYVKCLGSESVARSLENSTIDLDDVTEGKPLDIFITIPPEKLKSHRALLRLWVGSLLNAIMRRKAIPDRRTLFVLDEAAQLGTFDPLLTAATLLRGYGLQLVTIWQDLAQMKTRYPKDWATILNNSGALLAFGFGHFSAAKEYGEMLGVDPRDLATMAPDEAALAVRGEGTRRITRVNYLKEPLLGELADPNPYFEGEKGRGK